MDCSHSIAAEDDLSVGDVFSPQADVSRSSKGPEVHELPGNDANMEDVVPVKQQGIDDQKTNAPSMDIAAKSQRGRMKKKKQQHDIRDATAALSTVRGFTPMPSGDEDSDISSTTSPTLRSPRPPIIYRESPKMRPTSSGGGVSALKYQLDALNLSNGRLASPLSDRFRSGSPSNASACSDNSDQTEVLTSYEVPLENDFVSSEAANEETVTGEMAGGTEQQDMRDQVLRKMTADDFEPLLCLGKGSFGTVLLVRHKATGKLYAQKQFRKASLTVHKKLVEQTRTERAILESISRHPFVVKLFYAFQDHEKLYLILEYAQGGELFTHLAMERMFDEDVASFYMAEMVLALEHLHQNVGVIYRDLKPENCLLDDRGHLLLTDFGLSKIAVNDDDRCGSSLGTVEYMAPEVIQGKPYGKTCDWWSLGALGYDFLTGSPPFRANNNAKLRERIVKQKLTFPYFLGPDAKDLLTRLLRKEPSKRLGYHMPKDLQTIKQHRFFRKIDWRALERREVSPPIKPVITDPALAENFSVDFTQLPMSPVISSNPLLEGDGGGRNGSTHDVSFATSDAMPVSTGVVGGSESDPFRGFSFVASSSVLEHGLGIMASSH